MSKKKIVENHLNEGKTITSMEAFEKYGITRLSAIIFNLRKEGMVILAESKKTTDRFGNSVHFSEYRKAEE